MSQEITKAFVNQYRDNVILLAQQKGSRLRGTVREEELVGKAYFFERIGATAAIKKTTRHADTPLISTPHSRRRVTPEDYWWADLIDDEDKIRMLIDPQSPYALNAGYAVGRAIDIGILVAAGGNAYSVDEDDAASAVALPAGQEIAENFDTTTTLTLSKLLEAKRILDSAEVHPDSRRIMVVNAKNVYDLLKTTQVQSADYNTVKALVQGTVNTFAGFDFVRTELYTNANGTHARAAKNDVIAWAEPTVGLAINRDMVTKMDRRPDKGYSLQVFVAATFGATRIEDEGVVSILCT